MIPASPWFVARLQAEAKKEAAYRIRAEKRERVIMAVAWGIWGAGFMLWLCFMTS